MRPAYEFLRQVEDFFEPWELVEYLGLRMDDIMDNFEDEILEAEEDLQEFMGIARESEETEE